MATQSYFKKLPETEASWRRAATAADVVQKTLGSYQGLRSGSKTTQTQFLLYRTICPKIKKPGDFNGANFNLAQNLATARARLAASQDFQDYLAVVGTDNQPANVTRFEDVHEQQREVIRGLDNPDDPLKKHDEDVVNACFILMLQRILKTDSLDGPLPMTKKWRLSKIRLTADFSTTSQTRRGVASRQHRYTAITDGQLQDIATGKIEAIVECKLRERKYHSPDCDMQEVSEALALIKQYPDARSKEEHQRVTVSQDGRELYISFHNYDNSWLDYVENQTLTAKTSLMTTRRSNEDRFHCTSILKFVIPGRKVDWVLSNEPAPHRGAEV
ncbi:hypothetical protein N8T08_009465 [Aspergillus melleus]|uniref:Uncharacterized protein n=1 Tax=Aspergillus melleus TaxID=138277 RepID=A0ACC3BD84_9EURO|nr:hypothetical protein N8T08_009465 [Aspergillus melleus]